MWLQLGGDSGSLKLDQEWSGIMRSAIVILGVLLTAASVGGCRGQDFNWDTFRFERTSPRDRSSEPVTMRVPPPAARPEPAPRPRREAVDDERGRIYRLYVTRNAELEAETGARVQVVGDAPVEKLADILWLMYPGEGPGGSRDTRYIVYLNSEVRDLAAAYAGLLDVGEPAEGEGGNAVWAEALSALYASEFPRKLDQASRLRAVGRLERVAQDPQAERELRWGAGILLWYVNTRFDPKDRAAASTGLALAARAATGDAYGTMVVRLHEIRDLMARKTGMRAMQKAREALVEFESLNGTACYKMIESVAGSK